MKSLDEYMGYYSELFQEPASRLILKISAPLALFALVGLLWSISFYLFLAAGIGAIAYYYSLDQKTALAGALTIGIAWAIHLILGFGGISSFIILAFAVIGLVYGQDLEEEKLSLNENLTFLLIGPLWALGPRRLRKFDLY